MTSLRTISLVLLMAFMLIPHTVSQAAETDASLSILSVDGTGSATASPDRASISIGVTTSKVDAASAQRENSAHVQAIINSLKELGINENDIITDNYSFRPDYSYNSNDNSNELRGYTVDNSVIVTIRNVDMTGQIIDTALSNGANQINSLDFSISNTKVLRKQALNAAIQDAREKADILAAALGHKIIGIHHVTENTGAFNSRQFSNAMLAKASMDAAAPIETGTITLDATVQIDFILDN